MSLTFKLFVVWGQKMPGLQLASENTTLQLHRSSDQQENQSLLADPAGGLTLPQLPGIYGC